MKLGKGLGIGFCRAFPICDWAGLEEPSEHRANTVGAQGYFLLCREVQNPINQSRAVLLELAVDRRIALQFTEHGQSSSHGQGIAGERDRLVDGAERRDHVTAISTASLRARSRHASDVG